MDGTYVHSSVRPKNKKSERVDRRLKENANLKKCAILVMCNRYTQEETEQNPYLIGAKKTFTFQIKTENAKMINKLAAAHIEQGSRICTDENPAYDELLIQYDLKRVNHQQEYCSDDGITNNLAESYFSRFKRMYYGQVHHVSNKYLENYANEIAYREDNRRIDNLTLFEDVTCQCLKTLNNTNWQGYWQKGVKWERKSI